jgi:hypothetical protein
MRLGIRLQNPVGSRAGNGPLPVDLRLNSDPERLRVPTGCESQHTEWRSRSAAMRAFPSRRPSWVCPWADDDSSEDNSQTIDAIEHAIFPQVEPPLSGMTSSLTNPKPRVRAKRILEQVK